MKPKVKICCISSIAEANMAIKYGANAIGLVSKMPSGPGIISDSLIATIAGHISNNIETFLLTSKTNAFEIIEQYKQVLTTTIQLVDEVAIADFNIIKNALPKVKIIQVIHVINQNSLKRALQIAPLVDALLLDSGKPNAPIKQLGGTGKTHNWAISKQIAAQCKKPVYLAGGLNAQNIQAAISLVKPYGVDLCSALRTNNKLDEIKLKAFFDALNTIV